MLKRLLLVTATALLATAPAFARETAPAPAENAALQSDLAIEDGWIVGQLDNGMRYLIRRNDRPEGTALVRMEIAAGRLDEREGERGLAHYVEHMAFNGSTNVPEGEMVKLLERLGLAFGADTNAATAFDYTQYKLDLPRTDPALLDTALMLMRETASELLFDPEAVERERGILLAERRDRTNFTSLAAADQIDFMFPGSRFSSRFPLADREDVATADAATLKGFWARNYVPGKTTLVVVGDFDPADVEARIRARFSDWQAAPVDPQPDAGPSDPAYAGQTDIYLDPALDEQVTLLRNGAWLDEPDSKATRQRDLLRAIGSGIVNRRLQRLALAEDPPFRNAGFGTGDVFETARQTSLTINAIEGQWQRGMEAAVAEYRKALVHGFTEDEVAEQLARLRTAYENAAAGATTRSNAAFANSALLFARDGRIPDAPAAQLAQFESTAPLATPEAVLAALREHALPLDQALIRFQGRTEPVGGAAALRAAFDAAMAAEVAAPDRAEAATFAYTDFGTPGTVVADTVEPQLGIRTVRFANGIMLNLKRTELEKDRVRVSMALDGGSLLDTREQPLGTALTALFTAGGLGKHSLDELQTVLAGRTVGASLASDADSFRADASTTPRDLELQLQLLTAFLTDPGYRPEAVTRYRNGLDDYFARIEATPRGVLGVRESEIVSDGDPRFSLQPKEAYAALEFSGLRATLGDRLAQGAIELALVGDIDEEAAIALVARTLGALPPRENSFRAYAENRDRAFTADRGRRVLQHRGEANQALVRAIWPTTDDSDVLTVSTLNLLRAVVDLKVTEELREKLGKTYSPSTSNEQSEVWPGYGTFGITATVAPQEVDATSAAIREAMATLIAEPVDADTFQRARQPILERLDNLLKNNGGWLSMARRAQSKPDDISRYVTARARYEQLTPADVQAMAARFLDPAQALEIVVLPRQP
ncbi:MAG: insulinase family protein [Sphingomonadaceae bacterium]|nr:insulinase family protein [Sphingomonadaceae bacterium]